MMSDVNDNEITITKKPTIGDRLSNARVEKKLTIADIASELRLTRQTIELIEKEQWADLHGRAYARGYFSGYVKYLGLPEDELLAEFDAEYAVADRPLKVNRPRIEISSKKLVWLPSLVLVSVAVVGWFFYQQMHHVPEELVPDEPSSLFSSNAPLVEEENTESETVVPYEKQLSSGIEQQISPGTELLINDGLPKDELSDNAAIVLEQQEADTIVEEPAQQVADNNTTTMTPADAVLDLRFSDSCWVQVKDADNKILLGKLMTKDNSIVVKGRAPLTVVLGRASAVQVFYNDKKFDPSAFTQRDVAQFTLGAES